MFITRPGDQLTRSRSLAVLTGQWFAPTELTLSMEGDYLDPEKVLVRDASGSIVRLDLPSKLVVMSNHQVRLLPPHHSLSSPLPHQVYSDWIYLWCVFARRVFVAHMLKCARCCCRSLLYFSGHHRDVYISLKKSLKWVPIIGWVSLVLVLIIRA